MNKFIKGFIRKLQANYRRISKKARDLGLSLPIALLIFLTFFSIITIAVIQTRRDTTLTRASGVCGTETPACVYGSYMEPAGAEQICPGAWRKCRVSSTCKYECLDQDGAGGGNEGTGGTYNYPSCSGYNTAVKSTCEKEFGIGKCTKCTNDGKSVRWHQGTETSTKPETQRCEKTSCKQENPDKYTSTSLIYFGANNLYYSNLSLCQKKDKSGKTLSKMCDSSTQPKTSVSPEVSISPKDSPSASEKIICVELGCGQEYANPSTKYILGHHPGSREAYFKDRSTCEKWGTGYTTKDAICGSQNLLQVGTRMNNPCNEPKTISWLNQSQTVAGNSTSSTVYAVAQSIPTFFTVIVDPNDKWATRSLVRIPGGSGGRTITYTPGASCVSKKSK